MAQRPSADPPEVPYREVLPGAKARQRSLLRDRRDDLAEMSEGVRRVYVARTARLIAGAAATVAGAMWLAAAASPSVENAIAGVLPGSEPSVLSSLLLFGWVLAGLGYLAGRAWAEQRFARAMSTCVLPGDDVHHDLDRLQHVRPDEVAARLAQRIESLSVSLPLLAAALLGPATAIYLAMWVSELHYPNTSQFDATAAEQARALLVIAAAGVALAATSQLALRRCSTNGISVVRRALIPIVWLSLATCVAGVFVEALRWPAAGVGVAGAILFAVLTLAQKDRRALGLSETDTATDPSFRDMIRWLAVGIGRGVAACRRRIGRTVAVAAAVGGVAALGATVALTLWPDSDDDLRLAPPAPAVEQIAAPDPEPPLEPLSVPSTTGSRVGEVLASPVSTHRGSAIVDVRGGRASQYEELFWVPLHGARVELTATVTPLDGQLGPPRFEAKIGTRAGLGVRHGERATWSMCLERGGAGGVALMPENGKTLADGRVRVSYELRIYEVPRGCP